MDLLTIKYEFIESLRINNYSKGTIRYYEDSLAMFLEYLKQYYSIQNIRNLIKEAVKAYVWYVIRLKNKKNKTKKIKEITAQKHLSEARMFLKYMIEQEYIYYDYTPYLERNNYISKEHFVQPNKNVECYPQDFTVLSPKDIEIPLLMKLYLKYGSQVCSLPAIDRDFKTIDYLVILDKKRLNKDIYSMFFKS